jgi:hypothetical protein
MRVAAALAVALYVATLPAAADARKVRHKAPKVESGERTGDKADDIFDTETADKSERPGPTEKADRIDQPTPVNEKSAVPLPAPTPEELPETPLPVTLLPSASEPALGFSDRPYVRTAGGDIMLYPAVRLQIDAVGFTRQTPKSGMFVRRARLGLAGWIGRGVYFDVSVEGTSLPDDPAAVAPSVLPANDNYLALAPAGDLFILQVGQFDAPFTLENRTSDAYTDFIERAMVARSLGAPRNKEVGAMAHGLLGGGVLYYSAGLFNGNGPGLRNVDNQADAIGRVTVAPFSSRGGAWRRLWLGGSGWYGRHVDGPIAGVEATPGGVAFFLPRWTNGDPPPRALALREHGAVTAAGGELNLPLGERFGLRGEVVWKRQHLREADQAGDTGLLPAWGDATLEGIAGYGELWLWVLGDAELLPLPGRQLPARRERRTPRLDDGLMLAVRGEILKQDLVTNQPALGDPNRATTRIVSGTAGLNYWRGPFVRLSLNYVLNAWSGNSEVSHALQANGRLQHEVLLRAALNL